MKSVRARSFSGPHFFAFGLNKARYGLSLRIQSECGKIQTRKTSNTNTFHAVKSEDIKVGKFLIFSFEVKECHFLYISSKITLLNLELKNFDFGERSTSASIH